MTRIPLDNHDDMDGKRWRNLIRASLVRNCKLMIAWISFRLLVIVPIAIEPTKLGVENSGVRRVGYVWSLLVGATSILLLQLAWHIHLRHYVIFGSALWIARWFDIPISDEVLIGFFLRLTFPVSIFPSFSWKIKMPHFSKINPFCFDSLFPYWIPIDVGRWFWFFLKSGHHGSELLAALLRMMYIFYTMYFHRSFDHVFCTT